IYGVLAVLALACFSLSSTSQAETPQNVNVVNTPTVKDADNPARQPFQQETYGLFVTDGNYYASQTICTVSANKRLVIEYVSGYLGLPTGQIARLWLQNTVNNVTASHYMAVNANGAPNNASVEFLVGQPLRLYADPGTDVVVFFSRNDAVGTGSANVTLSGYLIN